MSKANFFSRPRPAPAGQKGGIPRQRASQLDQSSIKSKKIAVLVPPGSNPELPWVGTARYSRALDALRRLAQEGFEEGITDEMVSLSGRFASIKLLESDPNGACEVRIRRAFEAP